MMTQEDQRKLIDELPGIVRVLATIATDAAKELQARRDALALLRKHETRIRQAGLGPLLDKEILRMKSTIMTEVDSAEAQARGGFMHEAVITLARGIRNFRNYKKAGFAGFDAEGEQQWHQAIDSFENRWHVRVDR